MSTDDGDVVICETCAVERTGPPPAVCPICADPRQYVPETGQRWTDLATLRAAGQRLGTDDLEPGLLGVRAAPTVGINQLMLVVTTPEGSLLWDPTGYADEATAALILDRGPVLAIAASHPHMFGAQVEWSRLLGDAPVLVAEADREWLGRDDTAIEDWSGTRRIAEGLTLHQVGGHFPGSAVAHWAAGAGGAGVLLVGDTLFPNPDRTTISFMRSFPNRLPLSATVVERIARQCEGLAFDRMIGNFGNRIDTGAHEALRTSADRHVAWVRGDFDHLT